VFRRLGLLYAYKFVYFLFCLLSVLFCLLSVLFCLQTTGQLPRCLQTLCLHAQRVTLRDVRAQSIPAARQVFEDTGARFVFVFDRREDLLAFCLDLALLAQPLDLKFEIRCEDVVQSRELPLPILVERERDDSFVRLRRCLDPLGLGPILRRHCLTLSCVRWEAAIRFPSHLLDARAPDLMQARRRLSDLSFPSDGGRRKLQ
jgi:hypothetical protein